MAINRFLRGALLTMGALTVSTTASATPLGLTAGTYDFLLTNCQIDGSPCPDILGAVSVDATSVLDWSFTINNYPFGWDGPGLFQNASSATEQDTFSGGQPSGHTLTINDDNTWNYDKFPGAIGADRSGVWRATASTTVTTPAPEPASLLLLGMGFAAAYVRRRRPSKAEPR